MTQRKGETREQFLARRRGGPKVGRWPDDAITRFQRKYRVAETGCWEWIAAKTRLGYGAFYNGVRMGPAHRWAYEHFVGKVPAGLELDHLCRNRSCVNPAHLEPVTHKENNLRGNSPTAINARKTHCNNGHPLVSANLYAELGTRRCRQCKLNKEQRRRAVFLSRGLTAEGKVRRRASQ